MGNGVMGVGERERNGDFGCDFGFGFDLDWNFFGDELKISGFGLRM